MRSLILEKVQRETLVGLMLGDGHIEHSLCTNKARLKVEQCEKALEYVRWLHNIFSPWVRSGIKTKVQYLKTTRKSYRKYYFTTCYHEEFADFHKLFYENRRKIIPENIHDLLTPLGTAVWFMDDGSIKSHESKGRIFNTHAFQNLEVQKLCNVLKDKFSINSWPRFQKDGIQIYVSGHSAIVFQKLIEEYIVPTMNYKLPWPLGLTKVPKM